MKQLSVIAALSLAITQFASAADYHLYYLGGQSNMDGYGRVGELPDDLQDPVDGVMIFHGNTEADGSAVDGRGVWSELRPGHGVGYSSDGKSGNYSNRFGVELTFALRLKELYPERNIAIIKYSRGGTSIDCEAAKNFGCWDPDFNGGEGDGAGVNQYDHFLATLRNAMTGNDIDGDDEADRLIPAGMVWMQGESDAALNADVAFRYRENLRRLMDLLRAALRADDLPVAIGRISDSRRDSTEEGPVWTYGDVVRGAQAAWVESDGHAALVTSTDEYGYSDPWHYDSAGYIDLGRQFADALYSPESE